MQITSISNILLSKDKTNTSFKKQTNFANFATDSFVSSVSFTAKNQAIKLPIEEISKLWKTAISDMRKTTSIKEKETLFDSVKKKFDEEQEVFVKKYRNHSNEFVFNEFCHDIGNVIMEASAKLIYYKTYKNFEDEVASRHKTIIRIYKDYQVVIGNQNFSDKSYKQVFGFTMRKIRKIAKQKNIKISISDKKLNDIRKDKLLIPNHDLYFVFNNILGNAVKYTPQGGKIDISFAPVVKDGKKYLAFSVKDTGIGIKKEEIEAAKNGIRATNAVDSGIYGTGHGLAKVNRILKRTVGKLNIEPNESGCGLKVECLIRDSDDYFKYSSNLNK